MVRNDAEKEKKEVQREKFSQVATSPGAQRSKTRPIEQKPAPFSNLNFFVKNRQNFFAIELMNIH